MIQDLLTDKKYLFATGANTELRAQRNLNRRAVLLNGALSSELAPEAKRYFLSVKRSCIICTLLFLLSALAAAYLI